MERREVPAVRLVADEEAKNGQIIGTIWLLCDVA
jgi:hypothetical protein